MPFGLAQWQSPPNSEMPSKGEHTFQDLSSTPCVNEFFKKDAPRPPPTGSITVIWNIAQFTTTTTTKQNGLLTEVVQQAICRD